MGTGSLRKAENVPKEIVFPIPQKNEEKRKAETPLVIDAVYPSQSFPVILMNELPKRPVFVMGKGETKSEILASFLVNENNAADKEFVTALANYYVSEAEAEGVNHDVAFAQMCLETGFLRFGGLVSPEMNNFCGLGSIGPGENGVWFPSAELGVRAHIQHLKAYASDQNLQGKLVDPRFRFVRRGSAITIQGLAGTWAADKLYADKIELILERLYRWRDTE